MLFISPRVLEKLFSPRTQSKDLSPLTLCFGTVCHCFQELKSPNTVISFLIMWQLCVMRIIPLMLKKQSWDFPGGAVVKSLPDNAGDMPQLLSLHS